MSCKLCTRLPYPTRTFTIASACILSTIMLANAISSSSFFMSRQSFTKITLFSSTSVTKSLVLVTKRFFTVSITVASFFPTISITNTTRSACSICNFCALLYMSTTSILPRRIFCIKLLRSNCSIYAVAKLRIWHAASFPTI